MNWILFCVPEHLFEVLVLRLQDDDLCLGSLLGVLESKPVLLVIDGAVPLGPVLELQDQVQRLLLGVEVVLNLHGKNISISFKN